MRQKLVMAGCGGAILLVLMDGEVAQEGVRQGLALCGKAVLPALLPFFILSSILTASLWGQSPSVMRLAGRLFRMPEGSECLLIPAFLGGYPAGAAAVGEAWKAGNLGRQEAERLLGWCSNPGPSFLFGICAAALPSKASLWCLWGLLILGALTAARLIPGSTAPTRISQNISQTDILGQTAVTMSKICITVTAFRVVICYFEAYGRLRGPAKIFAEGLLELTNGCCDLPLLPMQYRMAAAGVFLSLGGLCVLFQTRTVTWGLSLKWYALGKGIQATVVLIGVWQPMALALILFAAVLIKNMVAFFGNRLYNEEKIPSRRKLCFSERK